MRRWCGMAVSDSDNENLLDKDGKLTSSIPYF